MCDCYFVSDLHGQIHRYNRLFAAIAVGHPRAVFLGGDLLPSPLAASGAAQFSGDFVDDYLIAEFAKLQRQMGGNYPQIFLILGNDDGRFEEEAFREAEDHRLWQYIHNRKTTIDDIPVYGYAYVPPTPFRLKDWEKYDVSRYVDPGCVSPEKGQRSIKVDRHELRYSTIAEDLKKLVGEDDLSRAIFLFHTPPYQTKLDRAALDGQLVDHVPLDLHIGSIAVKRFIEQRQPRITLHGHVHESARITGSWQDKIGETYAFSAAHDGPELALVKFALSDPSTATRELL